jgi:hypothetical protein
MDEPLLASDVERDEARTRRLVLLLVGVWIVNMFDLGFTLLAIEQRLLIEVNPVVTRLLLRHGPGALTAYKIAMLTAATAMFWHCRRSELAESGVWLVAIACVLLSVHWYQLYQEAEPFWTEFGLTSEIVPPELWGIDTRLVAQL